VLRVYFRQGLDTRRVVALWRLQYKLREPPRRWPQPFPIKEKRPAGKTPSPRGLTQFVAAALPNISIRAPKLGDRISLTSVARAYLEGLRCTRSFSAVGPAVRFGRVSQGACLKVIFSFFSCQWGHRRGGSARILWRRLSQRSLCAPSS
jgi:hypothetical protein